MPRRSSWMTFAPFAAGISICAVSSPFRLAVLQRGQAVAVERAIDIGRIEIGDRGARHDAGLAMRIDAFALELDLRLDDEVALHLAISELEFIALRPDVHATRDSVYTCEAAFQVAWPAIFGEPTSPCASKSPSGPPLGEAGASGERAAPRTGKSPSSRFPLVRRKRPLSGASATFKRRRSGGVRKKSIDHQIFRRE